MEAQSAGEIIPYAVERSDRYARAIWTAATLGALAGSLAAAVIRWSGDFWGGPVALWIALPPATGAALGWLAAFILPALRRLLVPPEVLAEPGLRGREASRPSSRKRSSELATGAGS